MPSKLQLVKVNCENQQNDNYPHKVIILMGLLYSFFGGIQAQAAIGGGPPGGIYISKVENAGSTVTARGTINFTGPGVSVADNNISSRTDVTITGGSGSSNLAVSQNGVVVSSPTKVINFIGSGASIALTGGATAQITVNAGDVFKASTQTFSGQNTFSSAQPSTFTNLTANSLNLPNQVNNGVLYMNGPPVSSTSTFTFNGSTMTVNGINSNKVIVSTIQITSQLQDYSGNAGPIGYVFTSNGTALPPSWQVSTSSGGGGGSPPGGSNTQFQYNNSGTFAGSPTLTTSNGNDIDFVSISTMSIGLSTMTFQSGTALILNQISPNKVLATDSNGVVISTTITSGSGTPGGSNTNVQFNNGGFGGDNNFQYDSSVSSITLGGQFGLTTGSNNILLQNVGGDPNIIIDNASGSPGEHIKFRSFGTTTANLDAGAGNFSISNATGNALTPVSLLQFQTTKTTFLNAATQPILSLDYVGNSTFSIPVAISTLTISKQLIDSSLSAGTSGYVFTSRGPSAGPQWLPSVNTGGGGSPGGSSGQIQWNNSSGFAGISGTTVKASGSPTINIQSVAASTVPFVIQGAVSQSGDLLDLKDSSNNTQSLFDANGNLGLQATSVTPGYSLQLNALSGGKLMVMGGVDAVGHSSNPLGIAWILSNLSSNNKQLTFFDEEQVGDGTKYGFRYILGFPLPMIDCINGQINTRGNFTLGYTDENVGVGFDVATAVQSDVKAKLHVKITNASDIGSIVQGASSQSSNLMTFENSSGVAIASVTAEGNIKSPLVIISTAQAGKYTFTSGSSAHIDSLSAGQINLFANNVANTIFRGTSVSAIDNLVEGRTSAGYQPQGDFNMDGFAVNTTPTPLLQNLEPWAAYSASVNGDGSGSSQVYFGARNKLGEDTFFAIAAGTNTSCGANCASNNPSSTTVFGIDTQIGSSRYGNMGVGVSTPTARLSVAGFINTATDTAHPVPVLSSCGTNPSLSAGATDTSGIITVGSGGTSSCTLTFGTSKSKAPACTIASNTAIVSQTASTTGSALTIGGTSLTSDVIMYICLGNE